MSAKCKVNRDITDCDRTSKSHMRRRIEKNALNLLCILVCRLILQTVRLTDRRASYDSKGLKRPWFEIKRMVKCKILTKAERQLTYTPFDMHPYRDER